MADYSSIFLSKSSLVLFLALSGCHCCGVSEYYGDAVDRIADKQCTLDRFYRPGLDLTRICHDCKKENPYCRHPVIYPESRISNTPPAEPSAPPVPPAVEPVPENVSDLPEIPAVPPAKELPPLDETSLKQIQTQPESVVKKAPATVKEPDFDKMVPMPPIASFVGTLKAKQSAESQVSKVVSETAPASTKETISNANLEANVLEEKVTSDSQITQPVSAPAGVPPSQKFYQKSNIN